MADQNDIGSGKKLAQGTLRRSLLKAGMALPLASNALLVACGGGGGSNGAGLPIGPVAAVPPTAPEVEHPAPAPAPAFVETPPIDPPPAKPVLKAVKNVRVLNLQTPTFTPPPRERLASEDMKTYTQRALLERFTLLRDALTQGLPKKSAPTDLCYFVVPEFFWNVNWDAVKDENDIKIFSNTCVTEVQKHVRALIALFPQEQYGKLALLPGTAQVLMKQNDGTAPTPAGAVVADKNLPCYEALNYVLVIDNFSKSNPDGSRPISMWPKRNVSGIDFDTYDRTTVEKNARPYWKVRLSPKDQPNPFNILVQQKSTTTASSYAGGKEFKGFDNDPLGGVPFGVDVCLDYGKAYNDRQYLRMSQIEDTNYIIDFLIACGMTADPSKHKYLPSVQYIVRNDGMSAIYQSPWDVYNSYGICEIFKLSAPAWKDGIAVRAVNEMVPQEQIANPAPHSILFDSYFDVHPLGEYPVDTPAAPSAPFLPADTLPSVFVPPSV